MIFHDAQQIQPERSTNMIASFIGDLIMKKLNRCFDSPGVGDANIKICVFQHFPCKLPSCFENHRVFVPIQAGRVLSDPIPGIIGDDTGENISRYNRLLNEITAIYWVGTHYDELGTPDYIGFNHYRRYLDWAYPLLSGRIIVASRLLTLKNQYETFRQYHHIKDLVAFIERFKAQHGGEYADFDTFWRTHIMYVANCFIMDRATFYEYFSYLKKCLSIVFAMMKDHVVPIDSYDKYQRRAYGFIMERMTSYFIYHARCNRIETFISSRLRNFDTPNFINGTR